MMAWRAVVPAGARALPPGGGRGLSGIPLAAKVRAGCAVPALAAVRSRLAVRIDAAARNPSWRRSHGFRLRALHMNIACMDRRAFVSVYVPPSRRRRRGERG